MMMNLLGFISFIKLNNLNYILNDTGDFDAFLTINNLEKIVADAMVAAKKRAQELA